MLLMIVAHPESSYPVLWPPQIHTAAEQLSAQLCAALLPAAGSPPARPRAQYLAQDVQGHVAARHVVPPLAAGARGQLHTAVRPQQGAGNGAGGDFGEPPSVDSSGRVRARLRTRDDNDGEEEDGSSEGEEEGEGEEGSSGGEESEEMEEDEDSESGEGESEEEEEEEGGAAARPKLHTAVHTDSPRPALMALLHAIGHGCGPRPGSLPATFAPQDAQLNTGAAPTGGPLPGAGCGSGWLLCMRDGPLAVLGRAMLCWGTLVASELVAVANVATGVRDPGLAQALCQAGVAEGLLQAALAAPQLQPQPFASPRHPATAAGGHASSSFGLGGIPGGSSGSGLPSPSLTPAQRGLCGLAGAHLLSLSLQRSPSMPYWEGGLRLRPSPLVDPSVPANASQLAVKLPKRRHGELNGPAGELNGPAPATGPRSAAGTAGVAAGGWEVAGGAASGGRLREPASPERASGRATKVARRGSMSSVSAALLSPGSAAIARAARPGVEGAQHARQPAAPSVLGVGARSQLEGVDAAWSKQPGGTMWPASTVSERRTLRVEARHVAAKDADAAGATLKWETATARAGRGGLAPPPTFTRPSSPSFLVPPGSGSHAGTAAATGSEVGDSEVGERELQGAWGSPPHSLPPGTRVQHAHRPLARALYALGQWLGSEVALLQPPPAALMSPRRDAVATPRHGAPVPTDLLLAALARTGAGPWFAWQAADCVLLVLFCL